MLRKCQQDLKKLANPERAQKALRFFKAGPGQYAEGDKFLGISNPELRQLVKKYWEMSFVEIDKLLHSAWHEERFLGLLILVEQYKKYGKKDEIRAQEIFDFYITHINSVNNWDLVDGSCPYIIGPQLLKSKNRKLLYQWAKSEDLWLRRISIVSTWHFIRNNEFADTLKLAKTLLKDREDLMHKAVGWMLREVGKKDKSVLDHFIRQHYTEMPRTALRYSIEKHPAEQRKKILQGLWVTS